MGNAAARLEVIERQADTLAQRGWRLAYSLLRDSHQAEDAVQQAFVVAARKPSAVPADDPWPWFAAVIAGEARNHRRKQARRNTLTADPGEVMAGIAIDGNNPHNNASDRELAALLAAELESLTEDEREAVVLAHVGGLSYRAAAANMGVAKGTFAHYVERGMRKLRRSLRVDEGHVSALLGMLPVAPIPVGLMASVEATLASGASHISTGATILGTIAMKKFVLAAGIVILLTMLIGSVTWDLGFPPEATHVVATAPGTDTYDRDQDMSRGTNSDAAHGPDRTGAGVARNSDGPEQDDSGGGDSEGQTSTGSNKHKGARDAGSGNSGRGESTGHGTHGFVPLSIETEVTLKRLGTLPPWDTGGYVGDLAVSPDGELLAVGSTDSIRVLDAKTGAQLWDKEFPDGYFRGLAFGAQTTRIFRGGPQRGIEAIATSDGDRLDAVGGMGYPRSISLSHDGKLVVASYSGVKSVQLWHSDTLELAGTFAGQARDYSRAFLAADNSKVLAFSASVDSGEPHSGFLVCWDVRTGQELFELSGAEHDLKLQDCRVAPDCSFALFRAVRAGNEHVIVRADLSTMTITDAFGDKEPIRGLALSRDASIAATQTGSTLVLWNPGDGSVMQKIAVGRETGLVEFSHDGGRVYSVVSYEKIRVWDSSTGEALWNDRAIVSAHTGLVTRIEFTADGRHCLSLDWDGQLLVWDVGTARLETLIAPPTGIQDFTLCGEDTAATLDDDGVVALWSIGSGKCQTELSEPPGAEPVDGGLRYSATTHQLIRLSENGSLAIWDTRGNTAPRAITLSGGGDDGRLRANQFDVAPDGLAVAIYEDANRKVWRVDLGSGVCRELLQLAEDDPPEICQLSFDGAGRLWFCYGQGDSQLVAMNFNDGTVTARLDFSLSEPESGEAPEEFSFTCFALSHDGKHALVAAFNRGGMPAAIWLDLVNGVIEMRLIETRGEDPNAVALSRDGSVGATSGDNKLIYLWDLRDSKD